MTPPHLAEINVQKRDGHREPVDYEKINRVVLWAAEGLKNVSASQVILAAGINFFDGIETHAIHENLIKSAADLITPSTPEYDVLAARLMMYHLRKKVYRSYTPPPLLTFVKKMINDGLYDKSILDWYTEDEINLMDSFVDHKRDNNFAYAAAAQLAGKYLVQNRVTGQIFETPQFLYIMVAATLFSKYPTQTRMGYIQKFYNATSSFKLSLPTPIMAGVRTPTRQFSSCVLIESDDSLDSINSTASAIVKYVSQRAGIGINAGRIRALGSPIRNGEAFHTGAIPFYKHFQTAVKSCSQGGVRGGAATLFYPLWHLESPELLVLKNNRGVEENRVRQLDYGVQFNRMMYMRLIQNKDITLFSPSDVPGLYDAFFEDQDLFDELYVKYENDPSIRKKTVRALEHFTAFMQERASTGRIYVQNVDHCNTHSPFNPKKAPIRQSNLCLEIALPTKPMVDDKNSLDSEIALCTLSAFNVGLIDDFTEFEELADLAIRALDELLDYQDYPLKSAEYWAKARRSLGVGIINYAYALAKRGLKYSDGSANNFTFEMMEAIQYYLLKASMELAKEKGRCDLFSETRYADGILPIDTYKKDVDKLHSTSLKMDWEGLRHDICTHGLRNSTVTALMPSETSSQISNATNGIEPPRGPVSVKVSKDGILRQVVPDIANLKDAYEYLWDIPDNTGYIQLVALMQVFVDQSISANTNYDPEKFESKKVPMKDLLKDLLLCYKLGVKTLYYHNTRDGASDDNA